MTDKGINHTAASLVLWNKVLGLTGVVPERFLYLALLGLIEHLECPMSTRWHMEWHDRILIDFIPLADALHQ